MHVHRRFCGESLLHVSHSSHLHRLVIGEVGCDSDVVPRRLEYLFLKWVGTGHIIVPRDACKEYRPMFIFACPGTRCFYLRWTEVSIVYLSMN